MSPRTRPLSLVLATTLCATLCPGSAQAHGMDGLYWSAMGAALLPLLALGAALAPLSLAACAWVSARALSVSRDPEDDARWARLTAGRWRRALIAWSLLCAALSLIAGLASLYEAWVAYSRWSFMSHVPPHLYEGSLLAGLALCALSAPVPLLLARARGRRAGALRQRTDSCV